MPTYIAYLLYGCLYKTQEGNGPFMREELQTWLDDNAPGAMLAISGPAKFNEDGSLEINDLYTKEMTLSVYLPIESDYEQFAERFGYCLKPQNDQA